MVDSVLHFGHLNQLLTCGYGFFMISLILSDYRMLFELLNALSLFLFQPLSLGSLEFLFFFYFEFLMSGVLKQIIWEL